MTAPSRRRSAQDRGLMVGKSGLAPAVNGVKGKRMPVKRQMVVFKVGGEDFAIDIGLAKEIVLMRHITRVPETHDYVEGVMNLRGNLVPVLDLRRRLRAGRIELTPSARIIIATLDGKMTGLIVDGASEVIRVSDEMIEPPPDVIGEIGADYIGGVINLGDRFVTKLELERAVTGEITRELGDVMKLLSRPGAAQISGDGPALDGRS